MTLEELQDQMRQMRADLDALAVKRDEVIAAIEEVESLQVQVNESVVKIKSHLKKAI